MRAFVTVGSTRFDALLDAILCTECIQALAEKGFHELVIQSGEASPTIPLQIENLGVHISCWSFKSSLLSDFQAADLVISHAGTGTILEVLRIPKPLIVVPNTTLLHNHQLELGVALDTLGHLRCTDLPSLIQTIRSLDLGKLKPFPPPNHAAVTSLIDEEMGYIY